MEVPNDQIKQCQLLSALLDYIKKEFGKTGSKVAEDLNSKYRTSSEPQFSDSLLTKAKNITYKSKLAGETRESLCLLLKNCYDLTWEAGDQGWIIKTSQQIPSSDGLGGYNSDSHEFPNLYTFLLPDIKDEKGQQLCWTGIFRINANFTKAQVLYFEEDDTSQPTQLYFADLNYDVQGGILSAECYLESEKKGRRNGPELVFFLRKPTGIAPVIYGYFVGRNYWHYLISGEIILEKVKEGGMAAALAKMSSPAPASYQLQLHYKFQYIKPTIDNQLILAVQNDFDLIQPYVGLYQGCFVSDPYHQLHEVYLSVYKNGLVKLRTSLSRMESTGVLYVKEPGIFMLHFDIAFRIRHIPLLVAGLVGTPVEPVRLEGFYGGVSTNIDPSAGRIRVTRISTSPEMPSDKQPKGFEIGSNIQSGIALKAWLEESPNQHIASLLRTQFSTYFENAKRLLAHLPQSESYNNIVPIEPGEYECFCTTAVESLGQFWIQRLRLTINPDLTTQLYSKSGRQYQGAFRRIPDSEVLVIEFEDFSFYLNPPSFKGEADNQKISHIIGVYAGRSRISPRAMGGRIKMFPYLNDNFHTIPHNFELPRELAFFEELYPGLIEFFLGKDDNMMESFQFFNNVGILPRSKASQVDRERIAGIYMSFKLNVQGDSFNLNPLCIFPDGSFILKSTREGGYSYSGVADVQNPLLTLRTYQFGDTPHFAQSVFRIWDLSGKDLEYLSGVSIAITGEQEPLAGLEILHFIGPPIGKSDFLKSPVYKPQSLKIPFKGEGFHEFDALDTEFNGVLRYMMGTTTSLIRTAKVNNKLFEEDKNSVAEAFFAAACYYIGSDQEKAIEFLNKARKEGFGKTMGQRNQLALELIGGVLSPIADQFPLNSFFFVPPPK